MSELAVEVLFPSKKVAIHPRCYLISDALSQSSRSNRHTSSQQPQGHQPRFSSAHNFYLEIPLCAFFLSDTTTRQLRPTPTQIPRNGSQGLQERYLRRPYGYLQFLHAQIRPSLNAHHRRRRYGGEVMHQSSSRFCEFEQEGFFLVQANALLTRLRQQAVPPRPARALRPRRRPRLP